MRHPDRDNGEKGIREQVTVDVAGANQVWSDFLAGANLPNIEEIAVDAEIDIFYREKALELLLRNNPDTRGCQDFLEIYFDGEERYDDWVGWLHDNIGIETAFLIMLMEKNDSKRSGDWIRNNWRLVELAKGTQGEQRDQIMNQFDIKIREEFVNKGIDPFEPLDSVFRDREFSGRIKQVVLEKLEALVAEELNTGQESGGMATQKLQNWIWNFIKYPGRGDELIEGALKFMADKGILGDYSEDILRLDKLINDRGLFRRVMEFTVRKPGFEIKDYRVCERLNGLLAETEAGDFHDALARAIEKYHTDNEEGIIRRRKEAARLEEYAEEFRRHQGMMRIPVRR